MRTKVAALAAVAALVYASFEVPVDGGGISSARVAETAVLDHCAVADDPARDPEFRPAVLVVRGGQPGAPARAGFGAGVPGSPAWRLPAEACTPLGGDDAAAPHTSPARMRGVPRAV